MIRRPTWILLVIFLVLAGFAFFYQRKQANKTASSATVFPTQARANLFDFDSTQVNEVKITDNKGNNIGLHLDPDTTKWSVSDLPADQANSFQIESVMAQLFSIQIVETLTETMPIESVGLTLPAYTIVIDKIDGTQVVMNVGAITAVGNGYYVRIGESEVMIVDKLALDDVLNLLTNRPLMSTPTPEGGTPSEFEPLVTPTQ